MKRLKMQAFCVTLLAALSVGVTQSARAQLQDLGAIGGTGTSGAYAINNAEEVFGFSNGHVFRSFRGVMSDLGAFGEPCTPLRVNSAGQVSGQVYNVDGTQDAFFYDRGVLTHLVLDGISPDQGGANSFSTGMNNSGQVVGSALVRANAGGDPYNQGGYHAFLYSDGVMKDLGIFGAVDDFYRPFSSSATAINEAGQIIGLSNTLDGLSTLGFLYSGGVYTVLLGYPTALNSRGDVIGQSDGQAYLYKYGTGTYATPGLGGSFSVATAINANGDVTGYAALPGDTAIHAFISRYDGSLGQYVTTDLHTVTVVGSWGDFSYPNAINDAGQVVGLIYTPGNATYRGFVYTPGLGTQPLQTLGGSNGEATGINSSGQVIGWAGLPGDTAYHAFIYSQGMFTDLRTLGGSSSYPTGINDAGQVTGYADLAGDTESHAFLYSPPVARCKNITVNTDPGRNHATVSAGQLDDGSYDREGDAITFSLSPGGVYQVGVNSVTFTVTDSHGASASRPATITVVDNEPPTISNVSVNPASLSPPDHRLVRVTVHYQARDNVRVINEWLTVTSSEPDSGLGGGDLPDDIQIINSHRLYLRAESGGNGRFYTITIYASDAAGHVTTTRVVVTVP